MRNDRGETKLSKQPTSAPTASAVDPCPTNIQLNRTPRHRKFTQRRSTTRAPLRLKENIMRKAKTKYPNNPLAPAASTAGQLQARLIGRPGTESRPAPAVSQRGGEE